MVLCFLLDTPKNADDYIKYVNQYTPKQGILLKESYHRVFVHMYPQNKVVFILKC